MTARRDQGAETPLRRAAGALVWRALVVGLVAMSCSAPEPIVVTGDLEYLAAKRLDVHAPKGGDDLPIVVLLHGAGLERAAYSDFATRISEAGAVVVNADWDVLPSSTGIALEQIACAVRYARFHAPEHGGDPDRLVLVGHSTAAAFVGRIAIAGDEIVGECGIDASALPDALAVLAPASIPGGWPWHPSLLGGNPGLRVAVVHGADDAVSPSSRGERTMDILEEAGYEVSFEIVPGGHYDLVMVEPIDGPSGSPSSERDPADASIAAILGLVADESD